MGILTYAKIGAAVVTLAVCGYFVWNYQHMQTKIVGLEEKIAGLELRAEVIEKAQKRTDEAVEAQKKAVLKNVQRKAQVDQVVESGNDPAMQQLYLDRGLLRRLQADDSKSRPKSNSINIPGRSPGF